MEYPLAETALLCCSQLLLHHCVIRQQLDGGLSSVGISRGAGLCVQLTDETGEVTGRLGEQVDE